METVLGFPRETEAIEVCVRVCVCVCVDREREREIYFKKLVHVIVKAGKSKIYSVGQLTGDPGKR